MFLIKVRACHAQGHYKQRLDDIKEMQMTEGFVVRQKTKEEETFITFLSIPVLLHFMLM